MAMRIEFIAPVESMRGNLSGKQNLEYPPSNNPAWDTPDNGVKYARNYQPRYIGSKRAATGRNYFSVKRKAGVNLSLAARRTQAALAVARIYANAIVMDASALVTATEIYRDHVDAGYKYTTLAGFLTAMLRDGILMGDRVISVGEQGVSTARLSVTNVFNTTSSAAGDVTPTVSNLLIAKFFAVIGISSEAILFAQVNSPRFPVAAASGDSWIDVLNDSGFVAEFNRYLNMVLYEVGSVEYIKVGDNSFLQFNGAYVKSTDAFLASSKYTTTPTLPTP